MPIYSTTQIAQRVGGELCGDGQMEIEGIEQLELAGPRQLSFVRDERHGARWAASKAGAALVATELDLQVCDGRVLIRVGQVDQALNLVLEMYAPPVVRPLTGVHPAAVVDSTAQVGPDSRIAPGCVVGARVRIGARCVLHPNVVILDDSQIGDDCLLYPGVSLRERCRLGHRVIVHSNAVIGADGFGFIPAPGGRGLQKVPHIGTVEIGDDVEIGAATCIDRGKFAATIIGAGTKIDNLCQIAHNVRIGRACVLAGQVGLAGSVVVGDGVMIGGQVAVREHIQIGKGARLAACAAVMDDVPEGALWMGYPAQDATAALREVVALRKLPDLIRKLRPGRGAPEQDDNR